MRDLKTVVEVLPLPLGIDNCYLLLAPNRTVIMIDGGSFGVSGEQFLKGLSRAGVKPDQIKLIILTHGHLDHVGAVAEIQRLTGAPIALHEADREFLEHGTALYYQPPGYSWWGKVMSVVGKACLKHLVTLTPAKVDILLTEEGLDLYQYGIPGRVVYTPGHSWGSVSIILNDGRAFVGDLANNALFLGMLRPGLPALAEDMPTVLESWRTLKRLGVERIYPAHGKPFPAEVMWRFLS